ncbi:hypothetical protein D3C81_2176660 [compost metagenome]
MPGLGEQDHTRRVEQCGEQQVLQATGVEQPHRVAEGDAADQQVLGSFGGGVFIGFTAPAQQHRISRRPQIRHEDHG